MSNVSDLKDALVTAAADITDTVDRLSCLSDIDDWYNARVAVAALQGSNLASYTIANRTVTRQQLPQLERTERQLWVRINESLYCRGVVGLDLRGSMTEVSSL